MTFRDRLEKLSQGPPGSVHPAGVRPVVSELRKRIDEIMNRGRASAGPVKPQGLEPELRLEEAVGGQAVTNNHGMFHLVQLRLESHERHGHETMAALSSVDMDGAGVLSKDPSIPRCSIEDALFIDTETTGLSGGTGTFPSRCSRGTSPRSGPCSSTLERSHQTKDSW